MFELKWNFEIFFAIYFIQFDYNFNEFVWPPSHCNL